MSLPHPGALHLSVTPVMPTLGSSHSLIKLSVPRSHHGQIGRPSRSGTAATVSMNSSGTSIDVPDSGQFDKYAAMPVDGKAVVRPFGNVIAVTPRGGHIAATKFQRLACCPAR